MTEINNPFKYNNCVACNSEYVFKLRDVGCQRTKLIIPLLCCLSCNTLTCIGDYKEDDNQLICDLEYNIKNVTTDRHNMYINFIVQLDNFLKSNYSVDLKSFCVGEVGCNLGSLINALNKYNVQKSIGYDINKFAIDFGLSYYKNIDIRNKLFGSDKEIFFDLVFSIDVFEHLKCPREVLNDIIKNTKQNGFIYITVPIVDKYLWNYLKEDIESQKNFNMSSPFRDNDVHVIHFSIKGLIELGTNLGLVMIKNFVNENNVFDNYPLCGILFQKI